MASDEYNIETLVIAILTASATFGGVSIEHHSEDADTVAKGNRLTVKCEPKTPMVAARSLVLPVKVWQADVEVKAQSSDTDTTFDGWRDAIDEAINSDTPPAAVITTATSLFSTGVVIDQVSGGGQFEHEKRRELTRRFRVVFRS